MDIETILTITIGSLLSIISYSLKRNIENQDQIIEELKSRLENMESYAEKKFEQLTNVIHSIEKSLIHFEELEKQFEALNLTVNDILSEIKNSQNSFVDLVRKMDKLEVSCLKNHSKFSDYK